MPSDGGFSDVYSHVELFVCDGDDADVLCVVYAHEHDHDPDRSTLRAAGVSARQLAKQFDLHRATI